MGSSTDAASATGSLYARIKALENNSGGASDVDITALEEAVGSDSDPANATGSLYARIAAVKNTADAAATKSSVTSLTTRVTTNEGNISNLQSDVGSLKGSVGTSADPANATGSLYARIAAVKNTADAAATKSSVDDLIYTHV